MRVRGGFALLAAIGFAGFAIGGRTHAQVASAQDLRSGCILDAIPALPALSASWSGTCIEGKAAGFGELYGFSAGKIRYIVRGHFNVGRLDQQTDFRDCEKSNCSDDVARSVLLVHEQHALRQPAQSTSAAVVQASSTAGSLAATSNNAGVTVTALASDARTPPPIAEREIRVPNATFRGRFRSDASKGGAISGEGRVNYDDGAVFEGSIVEGRKVGRGTYTWPDGLSYSGDWRDDQQTGRGVLKFKNGDSYEGDVVQGVFEGKGTYTQAGGDFYTGDWVRGKREGRGALQKKSGQRYEGEWRADQRDGQGAEVFPDGSRYDGQWRADRAVGKGDISFASGDAYTGDVLNGLPHGEGIYRWGSGDRFDGEFANGKPVMERGKMAFFLDVALAALKDAAKDTATPANGASAQTASNAAANASTAPAPVAPTRDVLCARAYNAANTQVALRRFIETFPDDECGRHALAKQKITAIVERERNAARAADERAAIARTFIGAKVAFLQDFPYCVVGTGSACQRVTYSFNVRAQIRDLDIQRRTAQVQVTAVDSLGQQGNVQNPLFAQGRAAATEAFRARSIGSMQTRTFDELGVAISGL
jgi:hypothetical protein